MNIGTKERSLMNEKKPLSCMVVAAQIALFLWMLIPQFVGGPGERYSEGRTELVMQLKQAVEQYRIEHKAYPRDLTGIKYRAALSTSVVQTIAGVGVRIQPLSDMRPGWA